MIEVYKILTCRFVDIAKTSICT